MEVSPLHPRLIYPRPPGDSNMQADVGIGVLALDLSVTRGGLTATQQLLQGSDEQISGDWLAIDSGSVGGVRMSFHTRADDTDSLLMTPGKIYNRKFHNARLFYTPYSPALVPAGTPLGSIVPFRALYGTGNLPFQNLPNVGSGLALASVAVTSGVVNTFATYNIGEGATLDISVAATQLTSVAANTSLLRAQLAIILLGGTVGNAIYPDSQYITDQLGGAAVGTARVFAKWNRLIVSKYAVQIQVIVTNFGTEATNNVGNFVQSVIVR